MIVTVLGLLAPFASVVLILGLRKRIAAVTLGGISISVLTAGYALIRAAGDDALSATFVGLPDYPLRIIVTPLNAALFATVSVVGLLVLVYAVGYMSTEPAKARFFAAMCFFIGTMQILVLAGDWVLFLATWELIALASYLLIGFHLHDRGAVRAANRAFLTTRLTDLGLYVGIFMLVSEAGSTQITDTLLLDGANATIASLLLLVGAMGKAAQVPFQGWLEDAMEGPTPVSALLHSATLVAAGIILLVRAVALFPSNVLLIIGVVGAITTVVAGVIALQERDLKRMLAASTSSQLALMIVGIGAGSWGAAIIHLVAHAVMKSALFLGAGVFQHARNSTAFSDLRGVGQRQRGIFAGFAIAGLALAGVPPLIGFWSKDAILSVSMEADHTILLAGATIAGSALTGGYVGRALRLLWRGEGNGESPVDSTWMATALAVLVVLTVVLGAGLSRFERFLDVHIPTSISTMMLSVGATASGLVGGWLLGIPRIWGASDLLAGVRSKLGGLHETLLVGPAMNTAQAVNAFDARVHRIVLGVGQFTLRVADFANVVDARDHAAIESIGRGSMLLAWLSRRTDEDGIERLIDGLVTDIREFGSRLRGLQSGLVSRELAYTAGAIVLLVGVILGALSGE